MKYAPFHLVSVGATSVLSRCWEAVQIFETTNTWRYSEVVSTEQMSRFEQKCSNISLTDFSFNAKCIEQGHSVNLTVVMLIQKGNLLFVDKGDGESL